MSMPDDSRSLASTCRPFARFMSHFKSNKRGRKIGWQHRSVLHSSIQSFSVRKRIVPSLPSSTSVYCSTKVFTLTPVHFGSRMRQDNHCFDVSGEFFWYFLLVVCHGGGWFYVPCDWPVTSPRLGLPSASCSNSARTGGIENGGMV